MKKLISFSLVAMLFCNAYAQDVNTKTSQTKHKSSVTKSSESLKPVSLDGRSFKVSFTEKQSDVKPIQQSGVLGTTDTRTVEKPVADYSVFDANSKVILTFSDGKILSPILAENSCPYHINVSGNEMIAFSSYCRMNTGNKKADETSSLDTKMKIDAANAEQPASTQTTTPDNTQAPSTLPPDETMQHLPPGVAQNDNADLNTPPAGTAPPVMKSEDIRRQSESPVKDQSGAMATISGVVNGNSIQGTMSWTGADGQKFSYTFSGSAATKKDMNDSQVVGMK